MPEPASPEEQAQRPVAAFLASRAEATANAIIVTHISRVFLIGDAAYKLKRAIVLPFLDYRSLDQRKAACEREVALNRRHAPELYLGAVPITREPDGSLALDGPGEPVDWVVHMKRYDERGVASHLAATGQLTPPLVAALADTIADFHAGLEPRPDKGDTAIMEKSMRDVGTAIAATKDRAIAESGAMLATRLAGLARLYGPSIEARRLGGKVRLCHGDMHLGNIVVITGRPVPVDGIEFSADIACVDVLFDLAFPVMDLLRYGLAAEANLLLNRYLAITRDYAGLGLLPLFIAARALIRAMSEALGEESAAARRYLAVAEAARAAAPPHLIAIGGLSGSGKSTVARALAPDLGAAPGAIILKSDEIRKRLFEIAPETRLPETAYSSAVSESVFAQMREDAAIALRAGATVILDATHMDPAARKASADIAAAIGVPFTGLWLDAPPDLLQTRVGTRVHDASDADAAIVRRQTRTKLGAIAWTRIDASAPISAVIAACRRALNIKE